MERPICGAFAWLNNPDPQVTRPPSARLLPDTNDRDAGNSRINTTENQDGHSPTLRVWPQKRYNPDQTTTGDWVREHVAREYWERDGAEAFAEGAETDKKMVKIKLTRILDDHLFRAGIACRITYQPPGGGQRHIAVDRKNMGKAWKEPPEGEELTTLSQLLWISNHSFKVGSQRLYFRTLSNMAQVWVMNDMGVCYDENVKDMSSVSRGCIARHLTQLICHFRKNLFKAGKAKDAHGMRVAFVNPFTIKTKTEKLEYHRMSEGVKDTGLMPFGDVHKDRNECYVGVPRKHGGRVRVEWYKVRLRKVQFATAEMSLNCGLTGN